MIDLNDLKSRSAINLLNEYNGKNPYLRKLKLEYLNNKNLRLTENQTRYIVDFHDKEPELINKVVNITKFLGEELKKQNDLTFTPERILVEFMLADTEKTFHVYGKLKRNQPKSKSYWLPKTQVLDDPYHEEINIDVDFDKWTSIDKQKRKPFEHQKSGVKFLLSKNGCILADDMGLGKCESVDNRVFTPNGRKRIGDIEVGDKVIGSNGKPINVLKIHPQNEFKNLYRITFNDGYSILTTKDHLFTVSSNNGGNNNKNRENKYITLSVEQMLDENLILKQRGVRWNEKRPYRFKTYYKQSNGQSKWQIPIVKKIEFNNNYTPPIDPYLLGVALGDGHIKKNGSIDIELHEDDFDEIFENQILNEIKGGLRKRKNSINILKEQIKTLNLNGTLSHTKFIPDGYKYSSIEDRISILQGLMDTDGHCMVSDKGVFLGTEYCTVSEQLADDVAEIVHSLGGIVRKSSKIGSYKKEDGTKVICKKAYRLNIKFSNDINPFRLKRKADCYNQPKKYKVGRYIKDITLEKKGEAVCISVDSPDNLYVTEHGIVTHNTYTAIMAALESNVERILIVCPSAVKINWEREINDFDDNTTIVNGKKWNRSKFTIINYDILKNFHTIGDAKTDADGHIIEFNRELVNSKFDLVIIDEAHYLKNHKSIRGEIMVDLCVKHNVEKVWLLTGTPIANRPMDFYNLLKLIKAPIADNWKFFAQRYCDGKRFYKTVRGRKRQIWLTDGASNLEELSIKTRNIILRRKKEDVLDMPDKTVGTIYQELDKKGLKKYEDLWEEYLEKRIEEKKRGTPDKDLVELILLRKFIALEAIPYTIELAENAVEQGQKVIIFTSFTDELNELANHFGTKCVVHNGPMSQVAKQNSVDSFQNNPNIQYFIGNIRSAGVGITLTAANYVIFNSFDWVPGNNEQAEDRAYRIGQKNNVTVKYQLFKDTISTKMWWTLNKKKDIISTIIGEKEMDEAEIERRIIDESIKIDED